MARMDIIAGLVSSTVAIPLAMAFGMFAFVTLGDEYFAHGAMAGQHDDPATGELAIAER
jgi:MFS superfamily sulfate permease-like transporter